MIELIYVPNCSAGGMIHVGLLPVFVVIMMISLPLLVGESEKSRMRGKIGLYLGYFSGLFPMIDIVNLFVCNAARVDTSYFWLLNVIANILLFITALGFIFDLYRPFLIEKNRDVNDVSIPTR